MNSSSVDDNARKIMAQIVIDYASSRGLQRVVRLAKKLQRIPTGYASSVNMFKNKIDKYLFKAGYT